MAWWPQYILTKKLMREGVSWSPHTGCENIWFLHSSGMALASIYQRGVLYQDTHTTGNRTFPIRCSISCHRSFRWLLFGRIVHSQAIFITEPKSKVPYFIKPEDLLHFLKVTMTFIWAVSKSNNPIWLLLFKCEFEIPILIHNTIITQSSE